MWCLIENGKRRRDVQMGHKDVTVAIDVCMGQFKGQYGPMTIMEVCGRLQAWSHHTRTELCRTGIYLVIIHLLKENEIMLQSSGILTESRSPRQGPSLHLCCTRTGGVINGVH